MQSDRSSAGEHNSALEDQYHQSAGQCYRHHSPCVVGASGEIFHCCRLRSAVYYFCQPDRSALPRISFISCARPDAEQSGPAGFRIGCHGSVLRPESLLCRLRQLGIPSGPPSICHRSQHHQHRQPRPCQHRQHKGTALRILPQRACQPSILLKRSA